MWRSVQMFILSAFFLFGCAGSNGVVIPPTPPVPPPVLCTPPYGWTELIYLELNPDVAAANVTALKHWCEFGIAEMRPWYKGSTPPTPPVLPADFDGAAYIAYWEDVRNAGYTAETAKDHYLTSGWKEGRWPLPGAPIPPVPPVPPTPPVLCTPPTGWTAVIYLELNPDVANAGVDALVHWCAFGKQENRPWKKFGPLTGFSRLTQFDRALSAYFSGNIIDGKLCLGTYGYQYGDHSSEIVCNGQVTWSFDSESVMRIVKHNGQFYITLEHGKYKSGVDKGMVYRLDGNTWNEVYRSDHAVLAIGLHSHADGYLYATMVPWVSTDPVSDIVRSKTGNSGTWEKWYSNSYEYRLWFMDSQGNDLWTSSASSLVDWGGNGQPSVFRNKDMVWRDTSLTGHGFWGVRVFNNQVFLGGTGQARVVRFSDKKIVLNLPGFETIHEFIIDKKTNTLLALANRSSDTNDAAEIWATKDGESWSKLYTFDFPLIFSGFCDDETGDVYIYGGRFGQTGEGYGRAYKGVRQN